MTLHRVRVRSLSCVAQTTLPLLALATSACTGFTPQPSTMSEDAGLDGTTEASLVLDASDAAVDQAVEAAPVATCNPAVDPTAALCLVAGNGLFVSSTGNDDLNDGSPAHPFATLGHALHATNPTNRVYVCGGRYTERVALQPGASANVYGGFSCPVGASMLDASAPDATVTTPPDAGADATAGADGGAGWAPGTAPTLFEPTAYDPANNWVLAVDGVTTPVTLQGLQFTAPSPTGHDSAGNGNSSFTAVVIGSALNLVNVTLTAGRGVDGAPGSNGDASPNYTAAQAPGGSVGTAGSIGTGGATSGTEGGVGQGFKNTCAAHGVSQGGNAGDVQVSLSPSAGSATPAPPAPSPLGTPPQDGAAGPNIENQVGDGDAHPGAYGAPGSAGVSATSLGTLTATTTSVTWTPTAGGTGSTGGVGQGGGGAGGAYCLFPADYEDLPGGGGGAGGCGGTGGAGGAAGGASIALVSINNLALMLTGSTLITGGGGTGGKGGDGQAGQAPGSGGAGAPSPISYCSPGGAGGNGGHGAGGTGGSGGTGGISAAVLLQGSVRPTLQSCTLTVGDPGHGGAAGSAGNAGAAWAGLPGAAGFDEFTASDGGMPTTDVLELP